MHALRLNIELYWDLGRLIVEKQDQQVLGLRGFPAANLWRMRTFYLAYQGAEGVLAQAVRELGWGHNSTLLEQCQEPAERLFYAVQARRHGWTRHVLSHHISTHVYQKTLHAQHNFETTLPTEQVPAATLALKDEYTFDCLELTQEHSEYELEQTLLGNVRRFLQQMGGDFTFVGNQYRLELEGNEYFIDLLLYHRGLQCLVAVERKITEFRPEYAGKMNFYLSLLNQHVRKAHEQPSIGIIIGRSKQRTIVEFALRAVNKPIGVATDTLPTELRPFFPSNEDLVRRLDAVTAALPDPHAK